MPIPESLQAFYWQLWNLVHNGSKKMQYIPTRHGTNAVIVAGTKCIHVAYKLPFNVNTFHARIEKKNHGTLQIAFAQGEEKVLGVGCFPVMAQIVKDDLTVELNQKLKKD